MLLAYFNDCFNDLFRNTFDVDYDGPRSRPNPLSSSNSQPEPFSRATAGGAKDHPARCPHAQQPACSRTRPRDQPSKASAPETCGTAGPGMAQTAYTLEITTGRRVGAEFHNRPRNDISTRRTSSRATPSKTSVPGVISTTIPPTRRRSPSQTPRRSGTSHQASTSGVRESSGRDRTPTRVPRRIAGSAVKEAKEEDVPQPTRGPQIPILPAEASPTKLWPAVGALVDSEIYTCERLIGDEAWKVFTHDYPSGWIRVNASGNGRAEYGFESIRISWNRTRETLPPLVSGEPVPGAPTRHQFRNKVQDIVRVDPGAVPLPTRSGIHAAYDETQVARVFYELLEELYGKDVTVQLGMVYEVPRAMGGSVGTLTAELLPLPEHIPPTNRRIWIWNDGDIALYYRGTAPASSV